MFLMFIVCLSSVPPIKFIMRSSIAQCHADVLLYRACRVWANWRLTRLPVVSAGGILGAPLPQAHHANYGPDIIANLSLAPFSPPFLQAVSGQILRQIFTLPPEKSSLRSTLHIHIAHLTQHSHALNRAVSDQEIYAVVIFWSQTIHIQYIPCQLLPIIQTGPQNSSFSQASITRRLSCLGSHKHSPPKSSPGAPHTRHTRHQQLLRT